MTVMQLAVSADLWRETADRLDAWAGLCQRYQRENVAARGHRAAAAGRHAAQLAEAALRQRVRRRIIVIAPFCGPAIPSVG